MAEYEFYYPGQYSEEDQAVLKAHQEALDRVNNRGEIDIEALSAGKLGPDTPGVSPRVVQVIDYVAEFDRLNYDPDNPLYSDDSYAQACGYEKKITVPMTANVGHYWAEMPYQLRDDLVISGLNHTVYFHKPVYVGDTLYSVADKQWFEDLTPETGSKYRTFGIHGEGRVFNQKGELVASGYSRTKESLARHADPAERNNRAMPNWLCPTWWDRPKHVYTDADWETIQNIWAGEVRRGMEPLYWEDVSVGDRPNPLAEGPVTPLDTVKYHGLDYIGGPSLKKKLGAPGMGRGLVRDESDGMYYGLHGVGHVEELRVEGHRPAFYNHMPVYHVIRMLQNWAGDTAWLRSISWRIMNEMPGYEEIPDFKDPMSYLAQVPGMEDKHINIHGLTGDLILVRAEVVKKYKADGKNRVDLVWWCETIDAEIYQEGYATFDLPSRQ